MILMKQVLLEVMVTAINIATVAQYNLFILPLFSPPFEMKAVMNKFVISNVIIKLFQSHTLLYSFLSAPSRIASSPDKQTVTEGSNLDMFCHTTGKPTPYITWTRVLENGTNSDVLFNGSSWRIVNIKRNFTGQYRCTADNGIGDPVNHTFPVNVLCEYTLYFQPFLIIFFLPNICEPAVFAGKFSCHILKFFFSIEVEIL